jgi:hypothetical protein
VGIGLELVVMIDRMAIWGVFAAGVIATGVTVIVGECTTASVAIIAASSAFCFGCIALSMILYRTIEGELPA